MRHIIISSVTGIALFLVMPSCTPLKSSPMEEKVQAELSLHEVQTNLDDLRHDLSNFHSEMEILDGLVKRQDSKEGGHNQIIEKLHSKIDALTRQISALEKRSVQDEKKQLALMDDIKQLSQHANETTSALRQYKDHMKEMEMGYLAQNKRLDEVTKLKMTLETIAKSMRMLTPDQLTYKVKSGDSLDKIARNHKVTVEDIKKLNRLDQDLIVIGQDLKIPSSSASY